MRINIFAQEKGASDSLIEEVYKQIGYDGTSLVSGYGNTFFAPWANPILPKTLNINVASGGKTLKKQITFDTVENSSLSVFSSTDKNLFKIWEVISNFNKVTTTPSA